MKHLILPLAFLFLLTGCENKTVFKKYNKLENMTWRRFNNLDFEVPVEKGKSYDFYFSLRHHTDYPYNFIDANVTFYTPNGERRSREHHYILINTDFEWKADGMGELWDIDLPIRKNMTFKKSGICKVNFENKMPKMITPGIIEVGLVVKESSKKN